MHEASLCLHASGACFAAICDESCHNKTTHKAVHVACAACLLQLQDERNQVLDKLNLVDMQVTALRSSNADLSAAVEAEQQRCAELEAALAARERVSF